MLTKFSFLNKLIQDAERVLNLPNSVRQLIMQAQQYNIPYNVVTEENYRLPREVKTDFGLPNVIGRHVKVKLPRTRQVFNDG